MRTIISMFCILVFTTSLKAQKEYKLFNKADSADFNYKALYSIDTFSKRRSVFLPVKGPFTVYTFIAVYKGISHRDEKEHDFHDILIIKVGRNNLIKDAFQYTLEWTEIPLSYDLYRARTSGVALSNGLSVKALNFRRVQEFDDARGESKEDGIFKLE